MAPALALVFRTIDGVDDLIRQKERRLQGAGRDTFRVSLRRRDNLHNAPNCDIFWMVEIWK